ncbi:MAG: DUF2723 domain-containing protein [Anaerolineae bacterium]
MATIAALYVSRVFVEFAPLDSPVPLVWFASLVLALASFALTRVAHALGCEVTPVAALALYLVSPTINPHLAAATAFVAITGVLLQLRIANCELRILIPNSEIRNPKWDDAGVFLVSLIVYTTTLSPGLLPADSGEFQLVAPTLGIAHPPGYALYTLVGKVFTLIPVGTPANRLNLMSAVLAAVTLTLVSQTTRRLTGSAVASLVAAAALAGATTFWAQATTANIRMPTAFFAALVLWLTVRYGETRQDRDLAIAAFALGLGLTHHGSLAFIAVPAGLYVLGIRPGILRNGRLLAKCTVAFVLPLLVLLYFPIRGAAKAPLDPGGLTTLDGFLNHVLARGFRGDVLAFTGHQVLLDRLRVLLNILTIQFGLPLLTLAVLGLILPLLQYLIPNLQSPISIHHWALLTGSFVLTAGIAITYRAPQTVEYLMPAYVALVILVGVGAASTSATLSTSLGRLIPSPALQALTLSVALLLGLANVWQIAPSYRQLSRQSDTRQVVEPILRDAPANATILSNWHWATAFWYLQTVEGLRPDVDVQYIAPAGAEPYPETWRRRLAETLDGRPVLLTNRYQTYADLPLRLVPFHDAFVATTAPVRVPAKAQRLDVSFENILKLRGYTLSTTSLAAGQDLTVRLWWEPQVDAQRDYSVFVHLIDGSGQPIGQADVRYPAGWLTQGTLIEDAYRLPVLPTVPPGEYAVIAGFYFTPPEGGFQRLTADGPFDAAQDKADSIQLDSVTLAPRRTPPVSRHPLEVPFAGGPTLVGVDYDTSRPFDGAQDRPESTRVYLHWRAASGGPWVATLHSPSSILHSPFSILPAAPAGTFVTTAVDALTPNPPTPFPLSQAWERGKGAQGEEGESLLRLTLSDPAGKGLTPRGAWRWPVLSFVEGPVLGTSVRLPRIKPGDRYLVFGGEMALVGADWQVDGDEAIVDLEWIGLRPLVRDYTVSVQLLGESGWRAQHDGTPALGAIPTLKWIRGTRVVDRHRIELPEGARGPADIRISVYDAFTQAPLGVLDDRFQRAGQGQAVVIGRLGRPPTADR